MTPKSIEVVSSVRGEVKVIFHFSEPCSKDLFYKRYSVREFYEKCGTSMMQIGLFAFSVMGLTRGARKSA